MPAETSARQSVSGEFAYVVASLAFGLAILSLLVLGSKAWLLLSRLWAYSATLFGAPAGHITAWTALKLVRFAGWSNEVVARDYLVALYVVVLLVGLSHANRTRRALTARRPKAQGKPNGGCGAGIALLAALGASALVSARLGMMVSSSGLLVDLNATAPETVFYPSLFGAATMLTLVGTGFFAICRNEEKQPTAGLAVRVITVFPAALVTYIGGSVVNFGLQLGLWAMMSMMMVLERPSLPYHYPSKFDDLANLSE